MLTWGLIFVFASLLCGAIGWGDVSASAGLVGRIFFFLFLVLFAVALTNGMGVSSP